MVGPEVDHIDANFLPFRENALDRLARFVAGNVESLGSLYTPIPERAHV
jgi:hypothetical protein